jgi:hypothetical protein
LRFAQIEIKLTLALTLALTLQSLSDPRVLAALTARLQRLTTHQHRRWGRMTAHQMAVHLAQVAEAALGRHDFAIPHQAPRRVIKLVALYLPLPWPRNLQTGADLAGLAVAPDAFVGDRQRAITTLADLAAAAPGALAPRHPIFGPMSHADWHRWAFLHVDHHLRQFGL